MPRALGALAREAQAQKLAQRSNDPARTQLRRALDAAPETEAGVATLLAAAVAWARGLGIDPEVALRAHTDAQLRALDAVTAEACAGE